MLEAAFSVEPSEVRRGKPVLTVGLLVAALAGYFAWSRHNATASLHATYALRQAASQLHHDTYDGYRRAVSNAELALQERPDSVAAHGILAYAHAILWGEHGGGDLDRRAAEAHLAAGFETGDRSIWLYAAEALVPYYAGDTKAALAKISGRIDEGGRRSSLLFVTQAIILMNDGDLDSARERADGALSLDTDLPRIRATLGLINHRRGFDRLALQDFESVRRFEPNHIGGIL